MAYERGGKEEKLAKETEGERQRKKKGNLVIHRHNSQTVKVTKCIACHFPPLLLTHKYGPAL